MIDEAKAASKQEKDTRLKSATDLESHLYDQERADAAGRKALDAAALLLRLTQQEVVFSFRTGAVVIAADKRCPCGNIALVFTEWEDDIRQALVPAEALRSAGVLCGALGKDQVLALSRVEAREPEGIKTFDLWDSVEAQNEFLAHCRRWLAHHLSPRQLRRHKSAIQKHLAPTGQDAHSLAA